MNSLLVFVLAILVLSVIVTFAASDYGEKMKNGWANIWCGKPKPSKRWEPGEDGMYVRPCHDRVKSATSGVLSFAFFATGLYILYTFFWGRSRNTVV